MKNIHRNRICVTFISSFFIINCYVYTSDNLIKNPGFEEENNSMPLYWSLFIQPQEGSFGKIDKKICHSGKCSLLLSNANIYSHEPMNNWSQRISINSSKDKSDKKEIHFEGWIATRNISGSYFLIQFWHQNPAYIIDSRKTDILSGTNDWKKMSIETTKPEGTDFIVIRCVIEGTGSAWFDDVSLYYFEGEGEETKEDATLLKEENQNKDIKIGITKIEQRLEELLKENAQLKDKISSLEEENKKIKEELKKINSDGISRGNINNSLSLEKEEGEYYSNDKKVPILVPHKKNWQIMKKEQE